MTPVALVDALVEQCGGLFKDSLYQGAPETLRPLKIFPQELPGITALQDPETFPLLLIQLDKATQTDPVEPFACTVIFLAGTYDENEDYQGWRDAFGILYRLSEHLYGLGSVADMFEISFPAEFTAGDENSYPYYFAALRCAFTVPGLSETASQKRGFI